MLELAKTNNEATQWPSYLPSVSWQKAAFLITAFFAAAAVGMYFVSPTTAYVLGGLSFIPLLAIAIKSVCTNRAPKDTLEHLRWDDLSLMLQNDYALGLANIAAWQEGRVYNGEALNLDFTAPNVWEHYKLNDDRSKDIGSRFSQLTPEAKKGIIHMCEMGIDAYIRKCPDATFLLIDYGSLALQANGINDENPLGMVGKQVAYSQEIKIVIPPPDEPLEGKALKCYYHNAIILAIRSYASSIQSKI